VSTPDPSSPKRLLADAPFRRLWTSYVLCEMSARIAALAVPLLAILRLGAGASATGLMIGLNAVAFGLSSLVAGVLADRVSPRRLLNAGQAVIAVSTLSVALAERCGLLSFGLLYASQLVSGFGTAVLVAAGQVYAARITPHDRAVEVFSHLRGVDSIANLVGPGLAGWMVGAFGAPAALVTTAACLLAAMLIVRANPPVEPLRRNARGLQGVVEDVRDGWFALWREPWLRVLTLTGVALFILLKGHMALYALLATRTLGLSPALFGTVMMVGGVGALLPALTAKSLVRRFGDRSMIVVAVAAIAIAWAAVAAIGFLPAHVLLFAGAILLIDFGTTLFNILCVSSRQAAARPEMLGRISSFYRFVVGTAGPIGGFVFGPLAERTGTLPTYALMSGLCLALALSLAAWLRARPEPADLLAH